MFHQLHQNGYIFLPRLHPSETTLAVGRSIGNVLEIPKLLPNSEIQTVQTLEPRESTNTSSTRYSDIFGLSEFPLHTDFAYWALPPRYILLRCSRGTPSVSTRLFDRKTLSADISFEELRRAIVRPRRVTLNGKILLAAASLRRRGHLRIQMGSPILGSNECSLVQV